MTPARGVLVFIVDGPEGSGAALTQKDPGVRKMMPDALRQLAALIEKELEASSYD